MASAFIWVMTNGIITNIIMPCGSGVLWRNVEPNEDIGNFRGGDCDSLDYMDWMSVCHIGRCD